MRCKGVRGRCFIYLKICIWLIPKTKRIYAYTSNINIQNTSKIPLRCHPQIKFVWFSYIYLFIYVYAIISISSWLTKLVAYFCGLWFVVCVSAKLNICLC